MCTVPRRVGPVRLGPTQSRRRFAGERVARLATIGDGHPGLVPIVFAVVADVLYTAVDDKPKSTRALRRLANIAANPCVAVLADHYEDDWSTLWWARADGTARILEPAAAEATAALAALSERYAAYRAAPPPGPVIAVDVTCWSGWAAAVPGTDQGTPA